MEHSFSQRITVIHSGRMSLLETAREFLAFRELLFLLALRHISIRYRQTALGVAWVVVQPLFAALIFTVIFGNFAQLPTNGIPYPMFSYSAMVLWTLFAQGVERASNSIVANERLITKIYFPRLIIPVAAVLSAVADFIISFLILLVLAAWYGYRPNWNLIYLPAIVIIATLLASGIGILVSGLNVRYRDFQHTIPFILQIWLYASPIAYSTQVVPARFQKFYYLNPLVGLIDGMRYALTGVGKLDPAVLLVSAVSACVIFIFSILVFQRVERGFADLI